MFNSTFDVVRRETALSLLCSCSVTSRSLTFSCAAVVSRALASPSPSTSALQ